MGTNYYRIPTEKRVKEKKTDLNQFLKVMELTPQNIHRGFRFIKSDDLFSMSPWDYFMNKMHVHLGKRSSGWKFCWNFHMNEYYSNKKELLEFIRAGRIVDEYGEEWDVEEFIKMALDWGEPDGYVIDANYFKEQRKLHPTGEIMDNPLYYDKDIDGLRVSRSSDFC